MESGSPGGDSRGKWVLQELAEKQRWEARWWQNTSREVICPKLESVDQ